MLLNPRAVIWYIAQQVMAEVEYTMVGSGRCLVNYRYKLGLNERIFVDRRSMIMEPRHM